MADIKLKSVDKNKIGEYIGECRSVMGGAKLYHWMLQVQLLMLNI